MSDCCDFFRFTDPGDGFSVGEGGQGPAGKSAYQAAVEAGFTGTEEEFNEYLSGIGDLTDEVAQQKSAIEALDALVDRKAGMLVDTASGAIASFVPDSTIDNLLGVSVAVEPVQDLRGQASPWPAGGGKNILNPADYPSQSITTQGITFSTNADGSISISGTATGTASFFIYASNAFPVVSGNYAMRLTFDGSTTGSINFVLSGGAGGSGVPYTACSVTSSVKTQGKTFSATASGNLAYVQLQVASGATVSGKAYVQIQTGSTADDWSPYENICPISGRYSVNIMHSGADTSNPTTYTIALGQTVYGGTLDVTNGTMTVDRAKYAYQGTETALLTQNGTYGYRIGFDLPSTAHVPTTTAERLDAISNIMVSNANVVDSSRFKPGQFELYPRTTEICTCMCIVPLEYNTPTLAKQWLTDNGFEVVYKLATPIEITLDPVTISTISGQTNNVWSDAGDVDVTYAADIKAYIDRLNQSPEDDMIANTLIQSGKYFTVNNRLFLSTASIAAGAQIIPGTNCTETSLVEALNALNA